MHCEKNRIIKVVVTSQFEIEEDDLDEDTTDWNEMDLIKYGYDNISAMGGIKGMIETYGANVNISVEED